MRPVIHTAIRSAVILLTQKGNWTFAPYYKFPLNQFTHSFFKDAAGFELTFNY